MSLTATLSGTGVALITPFQSNQTIDFNALGKLIDFVLAGGCDYLVTLGTTGETPVLTKEEKKAVATFTLEKAAGRCPVVIGIGGNSTKEVIQDLTYLNAAAFTAVLSASPYYNKPSQEGIIAHYKAIADASPVPVILYNVPGRTGRNMTAATTLQLAHEVANIKGMKEASGDMVQCMEIAKNKPADFLLVSGDDAVAFPQIACGMQGVISVAANCFPKEFAQMVKHALQNETAAARALHYKMLEAYDILFAENNPAGAKAFLYEQGMIENVLRLPCLPLSETQHQRVRKFLSTF